MAARHPHHPDTTHDNWFWPSAGETGQRGPTVCVDIDGVLADARHRQHLLDGSWQDWDSFFLAAGDDDLLAQQAVLLDSLAADRVVALVTARPAWISDITLGWLAEHGIRWDLLVMRANHDFRRSSDMKTGAVEQLRRRQLEPVLAFDDDPRNVAAYARLGIPCVYIHSGYHP